MALSSNDAAATAAITSSALTNRASAPQTLDSQAPTTLAYRWHRASNPSLPVAAAAVNINVYENPHDIEKPLYFHYGGFTGAICPNRPTTSRPMLKDTSSTALKSPYHRDKPFACSMKTSQRSEAKNINPAGKSRPTKTDILHFDPGTLAREHTLNSVYRRPCQSETAYLKSQATTSERQYLAPLVLTKRYRPPPSASL